MFENLPAMIGLAGSALGLTKSAVEVGKDLQGLVSRPDADTTETRKLVSDLLDRLIGLQKEQLAMQDELLKLQDEQKSRSEFQAQTHRYAMVKTELGALIYSLKLDEAKGEPPHDLCTNCFQNQIKSVLQPVDFNTLGCSLCATRFLKPDGRNNGAMIAPVSRNSIFDGY